MRLPLAILIALSLFAPTLPVRGQLCSMRMAGSPVVSKCTDCCATMKSCVLPQQNPARPAATNLDTQYSLVLSAPVLLPLLVPAPATSSRSRDSSPAPRKAHSPPRQALFCTFLI